MKKKLRTALALSATALATIVHAPIASAIPPDFPDLAALAPANNHDYQAPGAPGSTTVRFNTPFGYRCTMGARYISCGGNNLPGYVNRTELKETGCGQEVSNTGTNDSAYFSPQPIYCSESGGPVLQSGNKLSFEGLVCGVGADFTACIDTTKHGFVLRQDGNSTVF